MTEKISLKELRHVVSILSIIFDSRNISEDEKCIDLPLATAMYEYKSYFGVYNSKKKMFENYEVME